MDSSATFEYVPHERGLGDIMAKPGPKALRLYKNDKFKATMNENYDSAHIDNSIKIIAAAPGGGKDGKRNFRYGQYQKILACDPTKWGDYADEAFKDWKIHSDDAIFSLGCQANSDPISRIHTGNTPPTKLALLQACLDICLQPADGQAVPMAINVQEKLQTDLTPDAHDIDIKWEYDDFKKPTKVTKLIWTMICPYGS